MGDSTQSSPTMQGLLVLASLTITSAQVLYPGLGSPYGYNTLGLGYGGLGLPYTYGANILKPVVKEVEVPVETIKFEAAATGCTNSFGNSVPCLQQGEARKKRDADAQVIPYAGLGYAGYPYGYTGLGLGYTGLGLPYTYGANILKPAAKEAEEGEDRKKRDADDEEAAPAPITLPQGLPFGYSGLGYPGLGYSGLGYAGLAGLPYTTPTVTEVEVPQYKFVPQVKTVPVLPACQNAWGFGVPCA